MARRFVQWMCALSALVVAPQAHGQELTATLEGVVVDASGAVVPSASVALTGSSLTGGLSTDTGADGRYWFPAVPPGEHTLTVDVAGFRAFRVTTELVVGSARRLDVELQAAGLEQQVTVIARAPSIDTLLSGSFRVVRGDVARLLPTNRDFTSVVSALPGANSETRLAGLSIDGSSGAENRVLNDGADSTDLVSGTTGKGMRVDFLGEVQVKSSGYAAEFGGSTGGVLSAVMRSGTDQFRGSAATYLTGDTLQGAARPTLRRSPVANDRSEYVTFPDDDFATVSPLVTLGGPILRGKAWFFVGAEQTRSSTTRSTTLVNNSTGTFTTQSRSNLIAGNVDWRPSSRLRTRVALNGTSVRSDGSLPARVIPGERGTSSQAYPWADVGTRGWGGVTTAHADYVVGSWLFLNARAGHFLDTFNNVGIPGDVKYLFRRTNIGLAGVPEPLQGPNGFTNISTNRAITRDDRNRLTGSVAGTVYGRWGGTHVLKAGLQFERYSDNVLSGDQNDWVSLYWGLSYPASDGRLVRGPFGYYSYSRFLTAGDVRGTTLGLFVQDAWRVNDRLSVDLGLRTEREHVPSYDTSLGQAPVALGFGFGQKLAPRAGVAYDVRGNGRSRVYASAGRYYDTMKLAAARLGFGGERWVETFHTLDSPDWTAIAVNGRYPGQFVESLNYRYPANAPGAEEYGVGIDPNLQPFWQWETTAGYEHQFGANVTAGVRYVHKAIGRAVEDVGVLVPGFGEVFTLANPGFGAAKSTLPTACNGPCPDQPRAVRDYDAVEFSVATRPGGRWFGDISYVLSRLYGNYSGLANSDEAGRAEPNVNASFDALHSSFDQQGNVVMGRLGTDRPHQLKVNGVFQAPFGLSVGARFVALSGIPDQVEVSNLGVAFYPNGRGSLGRYPTFTQTDLLLQQSIRIGGARSVQLEANVTNLFDQRTPTARVRTPYLQSLNLSQAQFFQGFDVATEAARLRLAADPSYSFDGGYGPGVSGFQTRRGVRFALRLAF